MHGMACTFLWIMVFSKKKKAAGRERGFHLFEWMLLFCQPEFL